MRGRSGTRPKTVAAAAAAAGMRGIAFGLDAFGDEAPFDNPPGRHRKHTGFA